MEQARVFEKLKLEIDTIPKPAGLGWRGPLSGSLVRHLIGLCSVSVRVSFGSCSADVRKSFGEYSAFVRCFSVVVR
jgi:hypothetical protein